jgi:hypothetical protein
MQTLAATTHELSSRFALQKDCYYYFVLLGTIFYLFSTLP